jgi:hypothetical protein
VKLSGQQLAQPHHALVAACSSSAESEPPHCSAARRVAHQVAVALLDHIAKMDANAELDAVLALQAGITFSHAARYLDGTDIEPGEAIGIPTL